MYLIPKVSSNLPHQAIISKSFLSVFSVSKRMSLEGNLKLMKTLDDAWNGQDWDTFNIRHAETAVINLSVCPKVSTPIFIDIHIFLN